MFQMRLLIVPYGIEITTTHLFTMSVRLLIVPYGIEICYGIIETIC